MTTKSKAVEVEEAFVKLVELTLACRRGGFGCNPLQHREGHPVTPEMMVAVMTPIRVWQLENPKLRTEERVSGSLAWQLAQKLQAKRNPAQNPLRKPG